MKDSEAAEKYASWKVRKLPEKWEVTNFGEQIDLELAFLAGVKHVRKIYRDRANRELLKKAKAKK